jgi:hypothetical protein
VNRDYRKELDTFLLRHETAIVLPILSVALFLRLFNAPCWLLANVDEVAALNQIGIPFLSGACTSTNYLLTTLLLKTVGLLIPFPAIRLLNGLVNSAALYCVFRVVRSATNRPAALLTLIFLAFSWNVIYYARLFECGSLTPSMGCFFLCCVLLWIRRPGQTGWLYCSGLILGFHLNTHAMPSFYAMAIFFLFLSIQVWKRSVSLKDALRIVGMILLASLPYIYSSLAFAHFQSDLQVSYGVAAQNPVLQLAVNFRHPLFFIKTLAEYFTFFPISNSSYLRFIFTLCALALPLILFFFTKPSAVLSYCAFFAYGTLLLIGLFPIPVYNEGHLHYFWPHYVLFLSLLVTHCRGYAKALIALICIVILGANACWMPHIAQNQVRQVKKTLDEHLEAGETVFMSDGAYHKLRMLPFYSKIMEKRIVITFTCSGNGAMKCFENMSIDRKCVVFITSDGPWPPASFAGKITSTMNLELEELMEAHLTHGLRIHTIAPLAQAKAQSARPGGGTNSRTQDP